VTDAACEYALGVSVKADARIKMARIRYGDAFKTLLAELFTHGLLNGSVFI
jgi:hypothetical protein